VPPDGLDALLESTLHWLAEEARRHVVVLGEPGYPHSLLNAPDAPLLLYGQGRLDLLHAPGIAIVGSRNPTPQGLENARAFAAALSEAGFVVVSGLALGIDGAAHEGALLGQGSTIAVVGTGLDRVYPKRHLALAHRVAETGLMLSEFPIGTPPLNQNFPQRNRIIAGLAKGTLVVEAALQSGSLITARLAAEAGREVFAIPGSIHSPQSRGCHHLLKQGAKLVESALDIFEEVGDGRPLPGRGDHHPDPGSAPDRVEDDPVLAALGYEPALLDQVVQRTGWPVSKVSARLLELELEGRVSRLPGQMFQRSGLA
jgi:DNA processing protein